MSIINNSKTDPNKFLPIRFPWAREYYKSGVANNWTPEEIGMQKDVEQWKSDVLSDTERRMILWNMGFFSTAESLTANNIVLAVYRHITDPACRQYLLRQGFEEAIHTDMFVYCCDTLGLDPEEVYTMYQTIPSIKEKDDFVVNLTKSIFDPNFTTEGDENIQRFLHDLVGYYVIMEGIFFYAGFAMMLALKRQGKMVGIGEQFEYTMRDECCSSDTELLTPRGWKNIKEITYDDKIAQYNTDGNIEFVKPLKLSKSYVKNAYRFYNEQGHLDQLVSENHRMVYLTKHGNHKVIAAKDTTINSYAKMILAGKLHNPDGRKELTARERFLIAMQADCFIPDPVLRNGSICGYRTYNFNFSKERKINRLKEILVQLNWEYKTSLDRKGRTIFRVQVPLDIPTDKSFLSWIDLGEVSYEWCQEFIEELSHWDGHNVKNSNGRITYGCVAKENSDIVQAIASIAGYRAHFKTKPDNRKETFKDYHRVQICRNRNYIMGGKVHKELHEYNDFVYGIEVPSSFIMVRRNNAVSITGNSIHLAFGCDVINTIKADNPQCWTNNFQQEIVSLIQESVNLEKKYAYDACPQGLLGINPKTFCDYVEYIADRRLVRLELPKVYNTENPFPWMSQATDLAKEKNFFETRVTEYQVGQLDWD